jgi:D-glycero-D-manno-heptose 1,7-bisphosphate phosphatase
MNNPQLKKPAIFFDRDNTLIINDGYLGDPAGVILMPGAAHAVARARGLGFAVVTISNQSGVARGLFDEQAVQSVDRKMDQLLLAEHPRAIIDLHLYCPDHPDAVVPAYRKHSDLRKPAPGMLLLAARMLDLDLPCSWLVGDAPRDIEAGKTAGCRTILFHPPGIAASTATKQKTAVPDFTVNHLGDAMEKISENCTMP